MSMPASSIEAFAAVCARLDDPFAERAAVLAEAGLDERRLRAAAEEWLGRMSRENDDARTLTRAFREAYAAERRGPDEDPAGGVSPLPGMETLLNMAVPLPDAPASAEPAGVPARVEVPSFRRRKQEATTTAVDVGAMLPSAPTPFAGRARDEDAIARAKESAGAGALSGGAASSVGLTEPIDLAKIGRPVLAFEEPGEPTQALPDAPPRSGETAPVDVAAIARRVLAFGPKKQEEKG